MADDSHPPGALNLSWRATLDGAVYGEPPDVDGNVLVAKENDTLYAPSPVTGAIGLEGPRRPAGTGGLPCGGILPLGIAGTPVYPPLTQTIFAVLRRQGSSMSLTPSTLRPAA